jgi:ATP-dependent helicase HrpA
VGQYNAERRVYFGARQTRFVIHPSSSLAKKPPPWVMAFELVETSQLFARSAAKLDPEWLPLVGEHLLKRSYSEPHWSEATGRAVIKEHATLFGLQVLKDRTVDYASVAPGRARLMFLDHALVRGEYKSAGPFQRANRDLLDQVAQLRNKARRSDMLSDDEALLTFFDKRVPNDVVNGKTFEAWRIDAEKRQPECLYLSLADVLLGEEKLNPDEYPDTLNLGGVSLPLTYLFEPTRDNDGITVEVPLALVSRLDARLLDWTIPAWHETKLYELLLRLPKATQRKLGNLPLLANQLALQLRPFEEPFVPAVERAVRQLSGYPLSSGDLRTDLLPGYLRFTGRVIGLGGKVLGESRDIPELFERFGATARAALSEAQSSSQWRKTNVRSWDFGALPTSITEVVLGSRVTLYPAILDRGTSVELSPLPSAEEAHLASRAGVLRLALLSSERALAALEKAIPKTTLPLLATVSPLGPSAAQRESFRRQLVERSFADAFLPIEGTPRSREEFELRVNTALPRLEQNLAQVLKLVNVITPELRETRDALGAAGKQPNGSAAVRDMLAQLDHLFPADVLLRTSLVQLAHFPRYLKGLRVRLARALTDPRKDADKAATFTPVWQLFLARAGSLPLEQATQLRWAFEELRIATFAPELKPAYPVSVARLKVALDA